MGNTTSSLTNSTEPISGTSKLSPMMPIIEKPIHESENEAPVEPQKEFKSVIDSTNPGTYDDVLKDVKENNAMPYEGLKFLLNKSLSSRFQIQHNVSLSKLQGNFYNFGATYVGTKQISPTEMYPIFYGEMETNGNLHARVMHHFNDYIKYRGIYQIKGSDWLNVTNSIDYFTKKSTSTFTTANMDVTDGTGVYIAQHLQRITNNIDLGLEFIKQKPKEMPIDVNFMTFMGKYSKNNWSVVSNIAPTLKSLKLAYINKITENLTCSTELDSDLGKGETNTTVSIRSNIPDINTTVRGQIDSNYKVVVNVETILMPLPFTLGLCATLNHKRKDLYNLGISFTIG
ncbi:Mitochondrial import receptor subunit TOM40 [Intoshia linei]|uniref:Mitochondrial import receptor subunit TOM40 n=1 Tax=Intoshia linei TaxID=1819745 RepID=A0A177BB12_9BILA|nr:Mitochondrial import receptor subunit TOM40 [Intoshia linei]